MHQNTSGELPYGANLLGTATGDYTGFEAAINQLLKISFESLAEVLEHCGTSRQHNVLPDGSGNELRWMGVTYLIQPTANING